MSKNKDTENKARYEDYSVEELKQALDNIFLYAYEFTDHDIEEMDQIMEELKKKNPLPQKYTAEESWHTFQETYAEELSRYGIRATEEVKKEGKPATPTGIQPKEQAKKPQNKRYRRLLRTGLVATIAVILTITISLTASALGYNLWGWIPNWGKEILSFKTEKPENQYFGHIADILNSLAIEEKLCPTWLPADFTSTEIKAMMKPLFLHECFQGNNRELTITISPTYGSESADYQKEDNPPEEYIAGNTVHYIFDNTNEITAVWYTKSYTTVIIGNITIEEMKNIINSVYGEK